MKNQMKGKQGITLIALVITIIVLLILAGVTIATLTGDNGLLQKATSAKEENEEAIALEKIKVEVAGSYGLDGKIDKEQLNKNLSKINGLIYNDSEINLNDSSKQISILPAIVYLNGNAFTISESGTVNRVAWIYDKADGSYINDKTGQKIKTGDRVKYEDMLQTVSDEAKTKLISDLQTYSGNIDARYNTAQTINQEKNSLQWRILDISDEKIELISAVPTESVLKFKGYDGYNNMVYLIDEACSTLYNSDKGTARNLKIEDIEKYIKYNYREYPNSSVDTGKYGGTKEYLTPIVTFFPNIYLNEKGLVEKDGVEYNGTLGQSDQSQLITGIGTVDSNIKSTHTFWRKRNLTESDFEPIYYELLINDGTKDFNYWLSSRSVFCGSDILFFEGRYVVNKTIDAVDLITNVQDLSTSTGSAMGNYLRPVVTLIPNTKLAYNELGLWEIEE